MRGKILERFLQVIWRDQAKYLKHPLCLDDGSEIEVLEPGVHNTNKDGPDFLGGAVRIGGTKLSGDIEVHVNRQDWLRHNHDSDGHYSSVVLHVILRNDELGVARGGPQIPTLVLSDNFRIGEREIWQNLFEELYSRKPAIPCFPQNLALPIGYKLKVVEGFGEARLEELIARFRPESYSSRPESYSSRPESNSVPRDAFLQTLYAYVLDGLGYSQNRVPFRQLSQLLPLGLLQIVREIAPADKRRLYFESLFFNVAGLLPETSENFDAVTNEYLLDLHAYWEVLRRNISMFEVLGKSDWSFYRMRPLNSPYRRIAFAAELSAELFSDTDLSMHHEFFSTAQLSETEHSSYWNSHTSFGRPLAVAADILGDERKSALLTTTLLPAGIAYEETFMKKRIGLQQSAKRQIWRNAAAKSSATYVKSIEQELLESESVKTVRSEQGSLLLSRSYCSAGRCSECPVGQRLSEKGWIVGQ